MWNILNLEYPRKDLCQYDIQEGTILEELPTLVNLLKTSAEIFTQDNQIELEIKVFYNVLGKLKSISKNEKSVRMLQRVGTCLRKIVLLNLSQVYLDFAEQFLGGLQSQTSPILLPSRQQLEYILIRTQSAAKLICQALHYSREAFRYLIQRLRMGHLILHFTMAISATSRINIVFRYVLVQVFNFYKKLYKWQEKLKKGTTEWPKPLDLPEDLEVWLGSEVSDFIKPQKVPDGQIDFLSNFLEKQKNDTNLMEVDNINDDGCFNLEEINQLLFNDPDVGEVVSRQREHKDEIKRRLTESQNLLLEKIQNAKSLKKLTIIFNEIDVDSPVLLGEVLKPCKIRTIKKIFLMAKQNLKEIKQSDMPADVKEEQKISLIQSTRMKFVKLLGLIETKSKQTRNSVINKIPTVEKLKPVKKLKDLRLLFNSLYSRLQSAEKYDASVELEKQFKDRRAEIKRLVENNRKNVAKRLIFITSKEFLARFKYHK